MRPKTGNIIGNNYIDKYSSEIVNMFKEVLREKYHRSGPAQRI